MDAPSFTNLLAVAAIAFAAPFLLGLAPSVRLPSIVLEIVAGIAVGPAGFGWVEVDQTISVLAVLGWPLIAAGLLSVMIFPLTGLTLLRRAGMAGEDGVEATVSAGVEDTPQMAM